MLELNFNPFPLIVTERLVLRETSAADANEVLFLRSDKEVMKYIDRTRAESINDALAHIQLLNDAVNNNTGIAWAISLKNDPTMIGSFGIWRVQKENYRGEVGYVLHPNHQQKGIAHEALTAVLNYGFFEMELHSIEANINPLNVASQKLLKKNHFVREAYFRENYYFNGQFLDSVIYSLLKSDWQKQNQQYP